MDAIFKIPQILKGKNKKLIEQLKTHKLHGQLDTRAGKATYTAYMDNQNELLHYCPSGSFSRFEQNEKKDEKDVTKIWTARKFTYHHKNPEIKREIVKLTRESPEKMKYIEMLKEENSRLIQSLDTYSTWSKAEKRQAKYNYRSYLNVQALLREFEQAIPEWDTKITMNVNTSSYWDAIEHGEKPRGDITRYVRIRNVIGDCCEKCGSTKSLEIHHILPKSVATNDKVSNLKIYCASCHTDIHWSMHRASITCSEKVSMEA